jgi:signal transduction histidine kinase
MLIHGDSDGLVRLFVNLLDNAIKYTPSGAITVVARSGPGEYTIAVSDSGVGIPAEHLPHVFDRFYRVDLSRSRRGAGLGLAIAQEIARAHAGPIQVASQPGAGSTFTVHLPR